MILMLNKNSIKIFPKIKEFLEITTTRPSKFFPNPILLDEWSVGQSIFLNMVSSTNQGTHKITMFSRLYSWVETKTWVEVWPMNFACRWILKHTRVWSWDSHWRTKRTPPWAITLVQLQDIKQPGRVWSLHSRTNHSRHGCEKCSLRMSGEFQLKNLLLLWYYHKVFDTLSEFK